MNIQQLIRGCLAAVVALAACATPPPPPPPPPPRKIEVKAPPTEEQNTMDDTLSVCARLARGDVGVWKQMVYQSRTWNDLAARADDGSRVARCKMGQLITKHKDQSLKCTDAMVEQMSAFCGAEDIPEE